MARLHRWVSRIKTSLVRDGLHIYGQPPEGERFDHLARALVRVPNGAVPALEDSILLAQGWAPEELRAAPERLYPTGAPPCALWTGRLRRPGGSLPACRRRATGRRLRRSSWRRRAFRGTPPRWRGCWTLSAPRRRPGCAKPRTSWIGCWRGWRGALSRPCPEAVPPGGMPTSCPRAGTFTPSTPPPYPAGRHGRWDRRWRSRRSTPTGPRRGNPGRRV